MSFPFQKWSDEKCAEWLGKSFMESGEVKPNAFDRITCITIDRDCLPLWMTDDVDLLRVDRGVNASPNEDY